MLVRMTLRKGFLCFGLAIAVKAVAQTAFLTADSVAVFYPKDYDATQHLPSPIFIHELTPLSPLTSHHSPLTPVFTTTADGHSVATIHVGSNVDLYGTGEVTGPLRRNGRSISLAHVYTPAYGVDGGSHL